MHLLLYEAIAFSTNSSIILTWFHKALTLQLQLREEALRT